MGKLAGKGALVTGASGDIGAAIARELHGAGAKVTLSGTRVERLDALAAALGGGAFVAAADLGDNDAVAALPAESEKLMGSLDILVNNAGLTRDNLAVRMKDEDWEQVLAVNLSAAFRLCRGSLRGMMKRRWGRIINITSIVGVTGNAGQANYAASKAGLIGMSKALAQEVASRGVTINCIAPGFIKSAMTDALNETQQAAILANIPAGRMGRAEDIAAIAGFLAGEESQYITGQTLHVNGGMAMV